MSNCPGEQGYPGVNTLSIKRDISHYRLALSNAIWSRKFKPPAIAGLACQQYRHSRKFGNAATPKEPAERTIHIENKGMKWNGNNLYTILPIQQVVDSFYTQEMNRLKEEAERRWMAKLLQETPHNRL